MVRPWPSGICVVQTFAFMRSFCSTVLGRSRARLRPPHQLRSMLEEHITSGARRLLGAHGRRPCPNSPTFAKALRPPSRWGRVRLCARVHAATCAPCERRCGGKHSWWVHCDRAMAADLAARALRRERCGLPRRKLAAQTTRASVCAFGHCCKLFTVRSIRGTVPVGERRLLWQALSAPWLSTGWKTAWSGIGGLRLRLGLKLNPAPTGARLACMTEWAAVS